MDSHPIDVHVGKRLRSRRTILGRSQEDIGNAVGVTFQQIQKYERGINRIGSSRLYEFAKLLGVDVSYFFGDIEDKSAIGSISSLAEDVSPFEHEGVENKEILSLVRAYCGIKEPLVRKKILALMRSLCDDELQEDAVTHSPRKESSLEKV